MSFHEPVYAVDAPDSRRALVAEGGSATPEYRAPECVTHPQTLRTAPPASVDVYAVGAVFLELACGFPVWFPFNSRVCDPPGRPQFRCKPGRWLRGALAVPNREGRKVAKRQGEVVRDLCSVLRRMPGKGLSRDGDAVDGAFVIYSSYCMKKFRRTVQFLQGVLDAIYDASGLAFLAVGSGGAALGRPCMKSSATYDQMLAYLPAGGVR